VNFLSKNKSTLDKMGLKLLFCIGFLFASASADVCEESFCTSTDGCSPTKNNLLTTLPQLNKEFLVSLEFRADERKRGNVIHFTENGNNHAVGSRIPSLWWLNPFGKLEPRFAVNGNGHYGGITAKKYSLNEWHSVEFSQTLKDGKYIYKVSVNGEDVVGPVVNDQPQVFSNVKVYASSPWYEPLPGSIRNLLINTDSSNVCGGVQVDGCECSDHTETAHRGKIIGQCVDKLQGKFWCYVKNGVRSTCPDKKKSRRGDQFWSFVACDSYDVYVPQQG